MEKKIIDNIDKACLDTIKHHSIEQAAGALFSYMINADSALMYFSGEDNRKNISNIDPATITAFIIENIALGKMSKDSDKSATKIVKNEEDDVTKHIILPKTNYDRDYIDQLIWNFVVKQEDVKKLDYVLNLDLDLMARADKKQLFNLTTYFLVSRYVDDKKDAIDLMASTPEGKKIVDSIENYYNSVIDEKKNVSGSGQK